MAILRLAKTPSSAEDEMNLIKFLIKWIKDNYCHVEVPRIEFLHQHGIYEVEIEGDDIPKGEAPICIYVTQLLPQTYCNARDKCLPEVLMLSLEEYWGV